MVAAVSLPHESEEQNIPKKEVTHHLPPGAYPVYPQFMGMYILYFLSLNIINTESNISSVFYVSHLYKNFPLYIFFKVRFTFFNIITEPNIFIFF